MIPTTHFLELDSLTTIAIALEVELTLLEPPRFP